MTTVLGAVGVGLIVAFVATIIGTVRHRSALKLLTDARAADSSRTLLDQLVDEGISFDVAQAIQTELSKLAPISPHIDDSFTSTLRMIDDDVSWLLVKLFKQVPASDAQVEMPETPIRTVRDLANHLEFHRNKYGWKRRSSVG